MTRFALGVLLAVAACGPPPVAKTVSLHMVGAPQDARVTVDDEIVGTLAIVAARGVALPPGKHRVSVEAPGYFPWDQIVEAKEDSGPVKLTVTLAKVPD